MCFTESVDGTSGCERPAEGDRDGHRMTFAGDPRWCARLADARARAVDRAGGEAQPDRVDFDPAYDPAGPIECEVCGGTMRYIAACKILCSNCGYRRDCSDP